MQVGSRLRASNAGLRCSKPIKGKNGEFTKSLGAEVYRGESFTGYRRTKNVPMHVEIQVRCSVLRKSLFAQPQALNAYLDHIVNWGVGCERKRPANPDKLIVARSSLRC